MRARWLVTAALAVAVLLVAGRWAQGPVVLQATPAHGVHVSDLAAALVGARAAVLVWLRA